MFSKKEEEEEEEKGSRIESLQPRERERERVSE